jgi:hypothetical protein
MSTATTTPHAASQQLIEQRLEVIDGALLGLLPRHERLAAVAQVEARIRELTAASPASAAEMHPASQILTHSHSALSGLAAQTPALVSQPQFFGTVPGGWISLKQKRRSWLAVSAGVSGILAFALLFAIPVSYFIAEMLSEVLGDIAVFSLLGAHALAVAFGGVAAFGLGVCALVNLRRHREQLAGHGWAIAGLCTGSLPMLIAGAAVLVTGLQFGLSQFVSVSQVQVAGVAEPPPASGAADDTEDESGPPRASTRNYESVFEATDETNSAQAGSYVPPTPAQGPQPESRQPPIQSAGHEVPAALNPPPAAAASGVVPTPSANPPIPPKPEPVPEPQSPTEPQSAPRAEPFSEPVLMPESAPAISS